MKPVNIIASSRPHTRLLQSVRLLICLACLSLSQPFAVVAQANEPTSLPPAALEAVNKGIMAAKLPDYPLAIRYFEEARKLAPEAPVIHLNMGLAESKIPGRELRAIAWFGAYLAASPETPNVAAVKEQIALLEVRNQSNVSRLIKSVQDAAGQIIDKDIKRTFSITRAARIKSERLVSIAKVQTTAGDIAGAKTTLASALKTAELIEEADSKDSAREQIARAQAMSGDIAGAQKTADLLGAQAKSYALAAIAEAQAKVGISTTPNPQLSHMSGPQPLIPPVISLADWLTKLDDDNESNDCPLNTGPFLDLAGYLKSLPSGDPWEIFAGMLDTAEKIAGAKNVITGMLKQEIGK